MQTVMKTNLIIDTEEENPMVMLFLDWNLLLWN
jgi:hypothetical protein